MKTILAILFFPLLAFSQVRFNDFTTNTAPFNVISGSSMFVPTIYTTNLVTTNMSVTDYLFIGTAQVNYLNMLGNINQQGQNYTNWFAALTNQFNGDIHANDFFSDGVVYTGSGYLVPSNSWTADFPSMNEGDNLYLSSNGIPHVIYLIGGVTNIVRLVP